MKVKWTKSGGPGKSNTTTGPLGRTHRLSVISFSKVENTVVLKKMCRPKVVDGTPEPAPASTAAALFLPLFSLFLSF